MKKFFSLSVFQLFSLSAFLLAGCANFHTTQERTLADGTKETTRVYISTLFDSHNEVGKLRTTMTDKGQGISVGSVNQEASSTNTVQLLRAVGGILQEIK